MKKVITCLTLATAILTLSACGSVTEYQQDTQVQPVAYEQHTSTPDSNTDTNPNVNMYEGNGIHVQSPSSYEIIAGTVQSIDGMSIAIDSSSVFVANETGSHIATGEVPEPQETIVILTEETTIEVSTSSGGQVVASRIGTLDDLHLYNLVMVEGEWQGDEFVAITITIMNF